MAALISRNTDLKSLRYGRDRIGGGSSNQPYIKSPIPEKENQLDRTGGVDFLLRGGTLTPSRAAKDVSRLTKMFFDFKSPNGVLFTAKQNLLSRTNVKTQASGILNQGAYLPTSTILQAAGNAFGIHLNKQGLDPTKRTGDPTKRTGPDSLFDLIGLRDPLGLPVYIESLSKITDIRSNRLLQLKDSKLGAPKVPTRISFSGIVNSVIVPAISSVLPISLTNNQISPNPGEILKYPGGPGSTLGIGQTTIKRYTNSVTKGFNKGDKGNGSFIVLDSSLISGKKASDLITNISDFRKDILNQQNNNLKKNILSKSPDYKTKNIEQRVNLGDPGRRDKNVSSYTKGLGSKASRDLITAMPLYQSNIANHGGDRNDLVKFSIGIINNDDPNLRTYIHFRAFLDSMEDNYNAQWDSFKYMGRGENFYRYNGFTRNINLSWTVAAQSKEELIPMYQKLNFLASSLTPDFSAKGYMRGNLAVITVGGYLFDQPGIINSINYSVPQESPWEIGINDEEDNPKLGTEYGYDTKVKELPHIIKVTGFSFTPIHKFVPKLQKNTYGNTYTNKDGSPLSYYIDPKTQKPAPTISEWGVQRYIALATGTAVGTGTTVNNYDSPQENYTSQ
jgi:hypothetical protein